MTGGFSIKKILTIFFLSVLRGNSSTGDFSIINNVLDEYFDVVKWKEMNCIQSCNYINNKKIAGQTINNKDLTVCSEMIWLSCILLDVFKCL